MSWARAKARVGLNRICAGARVASTYRDEEIRIFLTRSKMPHESGLKAALLQIRALAEAGGVLTSRFAFGRFGYFPPDRVNAELQTRCRIYSWAMSSCSGRQLSLAPSAFSRNPRGRAVRRHKAETAVAFPERIFASRRRRRFRLLFGPPFARPGTGPLQRRPFPTCPTRMAARHPSNGSLVPRLKPLR
jgi:hypothetical protein